MGFLSGQLHMHRSTSRLCLPAALPLTTLPPNNARRHRRHRRHSANMNKSLEPTLTGLIPGLAGPLPPELIQLAASLVAQSKTRISNLKPQEEAGRQYVCAHIACDRLRKQLDLPTIEPRPPLPKKAYGALYTQFQKALPTRTRPPPTALPTASSSSSTPAVPPPSLPPALRAQISTLCTSLSAPGAHRHVVSGVTSMLSEDRAPKSHLPLVTAVALLVIEKLLPEGKNVTVGSAGKWRRGEGYIMKRDGVMGALGGVGKAGFTKEDTDGWVKELSMRGIRELGWLRSVPDGAGLKVRAGDPQPEFEMVVGVGKEDVAGKSPVVRTPRRKAPGKAPGRTPGKRKVGGRVVEEEEGAEEEEFVPVKKQKVVPQQKVESGIGTFMQERVDYLSEKKRKGYKEWEGRIRTRMGPKETGAVVAAT